MYFLHERLLATRVGTSALLSWNELFVWDTVLSPPRLIYVETAAVLGDIDRQAYLRHKRHIGKSASPTYTWNPSQLPTPCVRCKSKHTPINRSDYRKDMHLFGKVAFLALFFVHGELEGLEYLTGEKLEACLDDPDLTLILLFCFSPHPS